MENVVVEEDSRSYRYGYGGLEMKELIGEGPVVTTEPVNTTTAPPWMNSGFLPHLLILPFRHSHPVQQLGTLIQYCKELEEGRQNWVQHKKEATCRLNRLEQQLESEKARKRRQKVEEIKATMRCLHEEEMTFLGKMEREYREQLSALQRDAEVKETEIMETWSSKQLKLAKLVGKIGFHSYGGGDGNILPVDIDDPELEESILQHLVVVTSIGRAHHIDFDAATIVDSSLPISSHSSESPRQMPHLLSVQSDQLFALTATAQGISIGDRYKESILKNTRGWKERLFSRSSSMSDASAARSEVDAGIAGLSQLIECLET
ncbi:E3 ubiquitin-protein ligase RHF2A [Capsicum chinense]|nr:E3 ubiquitin-protein ligase RHF2A [Capsicum chinense]